MPDRLRLACLGCGFITRIHSRTLARRGDVSLTFASRERARADAFCREFKGVSVHGDYASAIADPAVDAVLVAVPTIFHTDLVIAALEAGKHVIVEKPAFPTTADFLRVIEARDRAGKVVLIGENDHYKPQAVLLRRLLAQDAIGPMVFANFTTIARRLKTADDWRNDESIAGGDAFFEEGIHWLHLAGSLGPRIVEARGLQPEPCRKGPDRRAKSMLAAFRYDNGATGALFYSREVPSALRGLRLSSIYGREGVITFESNGAFVLVRGKGMPRLLFPGVRDIRGYAAMHADFVAAIERGSQPEMSVERALEDQLLMDQIYGR